MEVAGLNLAVDSSKVAQATAELRQMAPAATAAEKATQKLTAAGNAASAANENFSRRVQGAIKSLEFERAQLARSSDERERYAAVRRAGVADASAEGRAIMASVAALQQQRSAQQAAAESMKLAQQQAAGYAALARQRAAEEAAVAAQQANLLRQEQAQRDAMAAKQAAQEAQRRAAAAAIVADLNFERQQLTRTAAEQAKYAALRRAGVSASSAEGQAIAASVAALQAQRAAVQGLAGATGVAGKAATVAAASFRGLAAALGPALLVLVAIEQAVKAWNTALASGDLGEQAEQVGVNTDQLQAYRLAAAQAGIESDALDTAITKLAKSMGDAADGNKDAIARFDQLGVKILDARGELRPVADVLPEVARGVLDIGSSSQRTATLMELFGRSGAKMATVLESLAKGNDAVIASARQENAITSPGAIAAWDAVADRMKVAELRWKTLVTEFGAEFALPGLNFLIGLLEGTKKELEQIQSLWRWIMGNMDAAKRASLASTAAGPAQADVKNLEERLAALRQNPTQFGFKASEKALTDQIAARQAALAAAQSLANQAIFDFDESVARRGKLPVMEPPLGATGGGTVGAGSPVAKASGGAGSTAKAIDEAGNAAKKLADWMKDANASFDAFMANQEVQRQSLFMSKEAASALKIETDLLNKAKADDVTLTEQQRATLHEHAVQMAASEEKTRQLTEAFEFAKEIASGFFADFTQGLRDGQSILESFGNAALNVLNKITDKLMQMAIDDLVGKAFGGGKGGGGGGFLSGIFGSIFSSGGGGGTGVGPGTGYTYANGAAFAGGNVIPFARGGVVGRPTLFPMANGMGLMGEAGPEAVMPLRRGPGGRLGVEASGAGGGGVVVNIHNYAEGTKATAKQSKGPGGEMQIDVIVALVEGKMASRMSNGQGSFGRVIEGKYGLQAVGR